MNKEKLLKWIEERAQIQLDLRAKAWKEGDGGLEILHAYIGKEINDIKFAIERGDFDNDHPTVKFTESKERIENE